MKLALALLVSACVGMAAARCRYRKTTDWSECDATSKTQSRSDPLKGSAPSDACSAIRTLVRSCASEDCKYERRRQGTWGECDPRTNSVTVTRSLRVGEAESCAPEVTETFDCRLLRAKNKADNRTKNRGTKTAVNKKTTKNSNRGSKKNERRQKRRRNGALRKTATEQFTNSN